MRTGYSCSKISGHTICTNMILNDTWASITLISHGELGRVCRPVSILWLANSRIRPIGTRVEFPILCYLTLIAALLQEEQETRSLYVAQQVTTPVFDITRISFLTKVINIMEWLIRLRHNTERPYHKIEAPLQSAELERAETIWISWTWTAEFGEKKHWRTPFQQSFCAGQTWRQYIST